MTCETEVLVGDVELIHRISDDLVEVFTRGVAILSTFLVCRNGDVCIDSVRRDNADRYISISQNTICMVHHDAADFSRLLNGPCGELLQESACLRVRINDEAEVVELTTIAELVDNRLNTIVDSIGSVLPRIAGEVRRDCGRIEVDILSVSIGLEAPNIRIVSIVLIELIVQILQDGLILEHLLSSDNLLNQSVVQIEVQRSVCLSEVFNGEWQLKAHAIRNGELTDFRILTETNGTKVGLIGNVTRNVDTSDHAAGRSSDGTLNEVDDTRQSVRDAGNGFASRQVGCSIDNRQLHGLSDTTVQEHTALTDFDLNTAARQLNLLAIDLDILNAEIVGKTSADGRSQSGCLIIITEHPVVHRIFLVRSSLDGCQSKDVLIVQANTLTSVPDLLPQRLTIFILLEVDCRSFILFTSLIVDQVLDEDTLLDVGGRSILNRNDVLAEEADILLNQSREVQRAQRQIVGDIVRLLDQEVLYRRIPCLLELDCNIFEMMLLCIVIGRPVANLVADRLEKQSLIFGHDLRVLHHALCVLHDVGTGRVSHRADDTLEFFIETIGKAGKVRFSSSIDQSLLLLEPGVGTIGCITSECHYKTLLYSLFVFIRNFSKTL